MLSASSLISMNLLHVFKFDSTSQTISYLCSAEYFHISYSVYIYIYTHVQKISNGTELFEYFIISFSFRSLDHTFNKTTTSPLKNVQFLKHFHTIYTEDCISISAEAYMLSMLLACTKPHTILHKCICK